VSLLDELAARGLIQECTDRDGLAALLKEKKIFFYAGYDPTAISLHAGNLVPLSVMRHLARAGHRMIAVVGGATGMVGDPSGKSSERQLLDGDTLAANVAALDAQIRRFVSADAVVVNNHDWFGKISFLEFLRDVGKHITVNYMTAKESVRARMEDREQGISYTEFSYMLLQGYDFVHLAREMQCQLQVGGSDQYGNITCGIELARKMGVALPMFGLVAPLLMTADGKKFGKSEKGQNVWLDAKLTSPFKFYQYWLGAADADVEKYLKMFTLLSLEEIAAVIAEHDPDRSRRIAQKRLAVEVTTWVHGAAGVDAALRSTELLFGSGSLAGMKDADIEPLLGEIPFIEIPRAQLDGDGYGLLDALVTLKLATSKSEARRNIKGVKVNGAPVEDDTRRLVAGDLATESMILVSSGKRNKGIVRVR
jgi:tyrosyl-tRNA synthetase